MSPVGPSGREDEFLLSMWKTSCRRMPSEGEKKTGFHFITPIVMPKKMLEWTRLNFGEGDFLMFWTSWTFRDVPLHSPRLQLLPDVIDPFGPVNPGRLILDVRTSLRDLGACPTPPCQWLRWTITENEWITVGLMGWRYTQMCCMECRFNFPAWHKPNNSVLTGKSFRSTRSTFKSQFATQPKKISTFCMQCTCPSCFGGGLL